MQDRAGLSPAKLPQRFRGRSPSLAQHKLAINEVVAPLGFAFDQFPYWGPITSAPDPGLHFDQTLH